jgi:ParB-like chromosome segregation protein Spo0J
MAAKKRKPEQTAETKPAEVKIAKQEYAILPLTSMKLHPKNPKKGDTDAIGESLVANDFYGAVIVQKSTGFILAGNHRWKSATEKGMVEIPVIVVDCDDATAERILLADNRIADLGSYDDKALAALVKDAQAHSGSLAGTGFMGVDLERMLAKEKPPTEFPEFTEQVKVSYTCPKCNFTWS